MSLEGHLWDKNPKSEETYLVHLNSDSAAGRDRALGARAGGTSVAANAATADASDGGVGRRDTGALRAEVDTVDPEVLEGSVGGNIAGQGGQSGKGEGLHGCEMFVDMGKSLTGEEKRRPKLRCVWWAVLGRFIRRRWLVKPSTTGRPWGLLDGSHQAAPSGHPAAPSLAL